MANYNGLAVGLTLDNAQATKAATEFNVALDGTATKAVALDTALSRMTKATAEGFKLANEEAKQAAHSAQLFSDVIGGIGKIATGAFGLIMDALKAPADLDNYLGQLNTKVTQIGGNLQSYKKTFKELLVEFKPGEGGYGLSPDAYKTIMMQFATGTIAVEKYGRAKEQNLKGMIGGAGMAEKLLGFSPQEASRSLIDLHKTVGLNFNAMEPFVKRMGAIGKTANMSSKEFYNLTSQVTKLAKSYNLGGTAAQKYVLDSLKVGSAISQLGMDAGKTMAAMNEVATGSEKGLIQSLLLGFKPGDTASQLKAFQEQAKVIESMAGNDPYLTKQLTEAFQMDFSPEDIHRLAGGGKPGDAGKRNPIDILEEIAKTLRDPATQKEAPYITAAQKSYDLSNTFLRRIIDMFDPILQSLKDHVERIKGFINGAFNFFETVTSWIFGKGDLTFTQMAASIAGLLLIPKIIGAVLNKGISMLIRRMVGGAAVGAVANTTGSVFGLNALASACGNAAFAVGRLSLWAAALYEIFKSRKSGWDDKTGKGADFYSPDETEVRKAAGLPLTGEGLGLKTTTGQGISPAMSGVGKAEEKKEITLKDAAGKNFQTKNSLAAFLGSRVPASALSTGQNDPTKHKGRGHPDHRAVDVDTSKLPGGTFGPVAENLLLEGRAANIWVNDERNKKGVKPHLHFEDRGNVTAGKLAQANTGSSVGGLQKVHDEGAYFILSQIRDLLSNSANAQPALAGSPTSNRSNEEAEAMWDRGNLSYTGGQ